MNVKEFREFLKQFPDEAIVEVVISEYDRLAYTEEIERKFEHWDFLDFRNNQFTNPSDNHFGKMYLILGVME